MSRPEHLLYNAREILNPCGRNPSISYGTETALEDESWYLIILKNRCIMMKQGAQRFVFSFFWMSDFIRALPIF